MCGPQELHSCSTSVRHQGGCQLLALPLHLVRSLGRCFCDSGDSVAAGAAVIFRGLSDRYHASLSPPPPRLSGPLPISELSGCQRLLAYLVPASACSHTASQVTPPALTAPTAAPPSGTLLQSSLHSALTHRHSSPRCLLTVIPASSDQCAGSRVFHMLAPLLPEHPAWASPLAGHSLYSTSVWHRGGKGRGFPDPNLPRSHRLLPSVPFAPTLFP